MLLYLDIDGVMIPDGSNPNIISDAFAKRLHTILDATGARIICTSTRRRSPDSLLNLLSAAGVTLDHLDHGPAGWATPLDLPNLNDDLSIRGQEIDAHLSLAQPRSFVILDDFPVLADHATHHVQPDERTGLTDAQATDAIAILKRAAHAV